MCLGTFRIEGNPAELRNAMEAGGLRRPRRRPARCTCLRGRRARHAPLKSCRNMTHIPCAGDASRPAAREASRGGACGAP